MIPNFSSPFYCLRYPCFHIQRIFIACGSYITLLDKANDLGLFVHTHWEHNSQTVSKRITLRCGNLDQGVNSLSRSSLIHFACIRVAPSRLSTLQAIVFYMFPSREFQTRWFHDCFLSVHCLYKGLNFFGINHVCSGSSTQIYKQIQLIIIALAYSGSEMTIYRIILPQLYYNINFEKLLSNNSSRIKTACCQQPS